MKKVLSTLLLLVAFCVPWVTQAQCDPIGTFPIAYGFETSEGFTSSSNPTTNTLGTCWGNVTTVPSGTTSERLWYVSTTNKHSGNQALCLPDKNSGNVTVLSFPAMNFTYSNGYLLKIWVYRNASGSSYPAEGVRVYASNTSTVTASSVELGFLYRNCSQTDGNVVTAESATGWYQYEFPITLSGTVYVIFQGESSYGNATYLDDITIEQMPTCQHPYNVVASNFQTDGATLSWTPSGQGETSYQYVCVPVGETPNWNNATMVNAPTVTLTGLGASSVYDFYVRSYCSADDQSSAIQGQFRTACGMLTLPFFTDFESEAAGGANANTYPNFIPCWTRLNDATSASYQGYPYIYNTTSAGYTHSGTNLLYLYSYKGTSTTYPYFDMAVMPQLNTAVNPANGLRLKFWGRSNTSNASPVVTIGVMSDPEDESSFETVTTLTLTGTTMTEYVVPLTSYTGTGAYVAFRCDRNETNSVAAYIDDVTLESMPTCLDPSALTVNSASITNSSCQISWTNGASETQWNVRYRVNGTTEWTELDAPVSTNPYTLTGLASATTYNVQVRAYCSATDQSPWCNIATFTTLCDAFAMPFIEDFNTLTEGLPNCWNNEEGTTTNASYKWGYYATGYDGACVRFNSYNNPSGATNVLASPMITLTGHPMLNFMAKDPSGDEYSVLIGTVGGTTRDTLVRSLRGTIDWVEQDIDLTAYTGQTVVIYFCGTSNYGSGDAYLYLDDFSIQAAPTCIKPVDVTFDNITAHTASVAWTSRGDETAWNIRYKEFTDTAWIEVPGTVTNPYTLSGLDMNTTYDVQVRAYCSADDQSEWSFTKTLLSGCEPIADLPWFESFELVANGNSSAPAPNCWEMINCNMGHAPFVYVYQSSTAAHSGNKGLQFSNTMDSADAYLIFPEFTAPLNTLRVTFSYKNANATTNGFFDLGYLSDITDENTFVSLAHYDRSTSWQTVTEYLTNVPNRGNARLAFRYGDATYQYGSTSGYIDDITVELIPSCADPSGLTLDTITSSDATLSWTSNGSETAWNIRYKVSSDTVWTEVAGTVTNPTTLTGLQPNTPYDVQVRAYCSADDQSPWTSSLSIRTACANITSLPWTVDFEDMTAGTIPACWDNSGSSTSTVSGTSPHYVWGVYNYGDNNMIRMYNYYVQSGSALINSIPITIPDDGTIYELKFDYSNHSNSGDMLVKVSTDDGATFTTIGSYSNLTGSTDRENPGTFSNAEIYLTDYAGETIILQFFNMANYGSGAIYVDNITICAAPSCLAPTDLVASNITTTSATIGWTANGAATAWNLRYKLSSASEWTVVDGTVANPYTLTNILPSSIYDVQVRGYCSADDQSEWSDSYTFATACDVITVTDANPYSEGFESTILPACWSQDYVSGTQDWVIGNGDGNNIYSAHGGNYNAVFDGSSYDENTTKLITPVLDLSALDSAKLSFWHAQAAWGTDQNELSLYYRTSATGEWTLLADYTNSLTAWTEEVVTLPNIGAYYQLAFEGVNNYGYDIALDDITVEAAPTEIPPVVYDTVHVSYYEKTYYAADNDWYYELYNPESDTTFYFDIVADSIISGQTYTLTDMLSVYCGMVVGYNQVNYSAASFTHTRNAAAGTENITAVVTLTTGQNYVIIYDAEIDTGMHYDNRDSDFVRNYTLAEAELDDEYFTTYGVVELSATASDMSSTVAIEFNVASLDADITIPEGVYTINTSNLAGTVVASPGVVGTSVYPSYAANVEEGYLATPLWFMENGTVTVRKVNGLFTALVEATNSYGRNIHILIGDTNAVVAPDSVTFVVSVNDTAMGTVNPMGTVRYAVGDSVTATATANEGYHFVDWTLTVMGMPVPMTENPLSYVIPAIIANQTVNVVANFAADSVPPAADSVTINISVNDPAMGTVDPMGTVRYAVGETVSATATANDGYHFVNWSISVMGMTIPMTENPLTYEIPAFIPAMAADTTVDVIANFEADSIGISQFNTSTPQQINIYPNPANSVANVKVSGVNGKVNVAVLDMNGRVVMSDSMECEGEAVKSLNVESLAQGAYFVRIYGEKVNSIQKFIVR